MASSTDHTITHTATIDSDWTFHEVCGWDHDLMDRIEAAGLDDEVTEASIAAWEASITTLLAERGIEAGFAPAYVRTSTIVEVLAEMSGIDHDKALDLWTGLSLAGWDGATQAEEIFEQLLAAQ